MGELRPTDHWYLELTRAANRAPHPPCQAVSIASSSPIGLFYCSICHATQLALRTVGWICTGGYATPIFEPQFGSRASNLHDVYRRIGRYSDETGEPDAVDYHYDGVSNHSWR